MPLKTVEDTNLLSPNVLRPDEEFETRKRKAEEELRLHFNRGEKELKASNIFGKAFTTSGWRPGSKKLLLLYQRRKVNENSKSALTASRMTTDHLQQLGWSFQDFTAVRYDPNLAATSQRRGTSTNIESAIAALQSEWKAVDSPLPLPSSMQRQSVNDLAINSSDSNVNKQLVQLSNSLFILACQGKIKDEKGAPFRFKTEQTPKIEWDEKGTLEKRLSHEVSLGVLFSLYAVKKASSELVVERTVGSYFQTLFDGVGKGTQITSGQQLLMFGPFTAFGSHPEPDLLARVSDGPHSLLRPVCLVGEAKTDDTDEDNKTVAQLATAAHSTLVLLIIVWCLKHHDEKFPDWAYLPGIAYTEKRVLVYAFYPQGGMVGSESAWTFQSRKISTYAAIGSLTPIGKLRFMHAMRKVQEHSGDFGIKMTELLKQVFVSDKDGVKIDPKVIMSHPQVADRLKMQGIATALKESLKAWDNIKRA